MSTNVLLCDFCTVENGKLFVHGGNITEFSPSPASVGVLVLLDPDTIEAQHSVEICVTIGLAANQKTTLTKITEEILVNETQQLIPVTFTVTNLRQLEVGAEYEVIVKIADVLLASTSFRVTE